MADYARHDPNQKLLVVKIPYHSLAYFMSVHEKRSRGHTDEGMGTMGLSALLSGEEEDFPVGGDLVLGPLGLACGQHPWLEPHGVYEAGFI